MSDHDTSENSGRFEVRTTADSHFAWLRTRYAVERTMMAYQRTSISLIGFGFAIFQFIFSLQGSPDVTDVRFPRSAWFLALALISCGIFAAIFSLLEYHRTIRYMWNDGYAAVAGMSKERRNTPLYAITSVLILIGIFAFLAVLLHMA